MNSVGYGVFPQLLKGILLTVFMAGYARAEPLTVIALGDSLTAGYGLAQEDGFVPQLETWLNDHGQDVRVVNAGVSGDTSAGGAARLGWVLAEHADLVLIALGGNDMLRAIAPTQTHANLARILAELDGRNLPAILVGIPGPNNFGPAYKAEFEAIFTSLAQEHGVPLVPNFLAGIADTSSMSETRRLYLQDDGLHPNKEGVLKIVKHIGPEVAKALE